MSFIRSEQTCRSNPRLGPAVHPFRIFFFVSTLISLRGAIHPLLNLVALNINSSSLVENTMVGKKKLSKVATKEANLAKSIIVIVSSKIMSNVSI